MEVDLFDDDLVAPIIATLREEELSEERVGWITAWETDPGSLDTENYLKLIDAVGKGRFAQRLASRLDGLRPPAYIRSAIEFVVDRV